MPEDILKLPLQNLDRVLREMTGDATEQELKKAMARVGDEYEREAVALAPHKTGYLENNTSVKTKSTGGTIQVAIEFHANYAADVHELPKDRRGPQTRAKPSTRFGEAGPKFLERVLRGMKFLDVFGEQVKRVLDSAAAAGRRRV